ncbi:MAG: insulinase family protein [Nitrospiraceae bacterium]|nr:insulinase family protein [Nitrospiraceae bacterium]
MYKKANLENGVTVVMEQIRNVRSVTLGIWVKVGSRNESSAKNGVSHFLEHMFFKGTQKRSAKDIAIDTDCLGGDLNAFTSRESTTFYVKVLDEHFERGVELLTDIFLHSTFPEQDVEKEKGIIKEEIKMVEDTPDEYIHDLFNEQIWGDEGIGQSILGKRETIKTFKREDLISHIRKYYGTKDIVIACAGNFEVDKLLDVLNKSLGSLRRGSEPDKGSTPVFRKGIKVFNKDLAEAHICAGVEGISQSSNERYVLFLLNTIFGAGISSRLFQEIREKRGLVYSVHSYISSYLDTGMWAVYAGTGRKKVVEVIDIILKEIKGLADTVTETELQRSKDQLKGNIILALESTSGRMQNIARQEIYYGKYYSPSEIIKKINSVSLNAVKDLSQRLTMSGNTAISVLGPVDENELNGILI